MPNHAYQIELPADQAEGHYADFAGIWHTSETFVMDFVAMVSGPQPAPEDSDVDAVIPGRVVTRVRLPASQIWEVMKALEKQYSIWEIEVGRREPDIPPDMPNPLT